MTLKKQKCVLLIATLCVVNATFSQSKKISKDSTTVIIFNQSSQTKGISKRKNNGDNNIIKIAPLGFISGTFPILYERKITDYFTIQGSLGITHKNYMRTATQNANERYQNYEYSWNDPSKDDVSADPYDFDLRKFKSGFMYSIQPRFYFESEAPEGNFLGLSLDGYKYNFEIPAVKGTANSNTQNGSMQSEYDNITDFMVHFGHQAIYDKLTFEYSADIGLRKVKGYRYAAAANYGNNSIEQGSLTFNQSNLNFNIGIKVGYHF